MKEIEVRIIKIDPDTIREKLIALNCSLVKKEDQINRIYDFENGSLLSNRGYARIRTIFDNIKNETVHYMTVKKLISQEKYKIMDESETLISDCDEGIAIFSGLGLKLIESIKKYRESYKYKNSLIEIDINDPAFCPFPYIEIETEHEDELQEIVELLGYTMADTSSATIYELMDNEKGIKGL